MHGRLKVRTSAEEALRKKKEQELKVKAYRAGMAKILAKREAGTYDEEVMELCGRILSANPDVSTLWNIRRLCIQCLVAENDQTLYDRDLGFTEMCLQVNPKSYGAWHHRCWVLENSPNPNWIREVNLCTRYLKLDERNFHCWDYRRYVVDKAKITPQDEFEFCTEKIQNNFSNYSSWHYRSQLLPILFPNEEDKSRPISESKLKQELELVITAAFTDPNDSSAWFYQRWLLGYSEPAFDIATFKLDKSLKTISISFTKATDLKNEIIQISTSFSDEVTEKLDWIPVETRSKHDATWIVNGFEGEIKDVEEFTVEIIDKGEIKYDLNVKKLNENVFIGVKMPKFGYVFGEAVMDELDNQLESCKQLLIYEPDSKWTLLTSALLRKAIDHKKYHSKIVALLEKLQEVDNMRAGYYKDLSSKWSIEHRLESWIESGKFDERMDLSGLKLTTLNYEQYLGIIEDIDLSNNEIIDRNLNKLKWLVFCKKLNLKDNNITSCAKFPPLPFLQDLILANNKIDAEQTKDQLMKVCSGLKNVDLN